MMPNIDPRAMASMMAKLGMKNEEINAERVIIERADGVNMVIENPSVMKTTMQGNVAFQVAGSVREEKRSVSAEVTADDIRMVMERTGVQDEAKVKTALAKTGGDIAQAIIDLTG